MDKKIIAILSYITIIGWIIAFVLHQDPKNKSELGTFHLRQTLGLFISSLAVFVAAEIISQIPILGFVGWLVSVLAGIFFFVLWLIGLIYAAQGEKKPMPVLGEYFDEKITFIN
jgi:uncharacterized membrane protein